MKNKISLALYALIIFSACFEGRAQKNVKSLCGSFPVIPFLAEFRQSALHFRQYYNGGDATFAEINAFVGDGEKPLVEISVTEKDRREVFYSNSESRAKELSAKGAEAYFALMDFKKIAGDGAGQPIYGFGFRDKRGQNVVWRFVPATPFSERGKGLIVLAETAGLRLVHRNRGTLAGDGTSIRVGDKEFEAEPMTELGNSHGFPLFRGSVSEAVYSGNLRTGEEKWRVTDCPQELKEGKEWNFAGEKGGKRKFRITAATGDDGGGELRVEEAAVSNNADRYALVLRRIPSGLAIRSISFGNEKTEGMKISFEPELSFFATPRAPTFQIDLGERKNVADGSVSVEKQGENLLLKWQFKSPDWAKSKKLISTIKIDESGYNLKFF